MFSKSKKIEGIAPGEPMVWFSGMWLAFGILMIVALLWVIVKNGLSTFWPADIVMVELVEDSQASLRDSNKLLGEVRKRQKKRVASAEGTVMEEIQLFIGNREVYNTGFRYVDVRDIVSTTHPEDVFVAERMEYGDLVGFPVRIDYADGTTVSVDEPGFLGAFKSEVREVNERRKQIKRIEKGQIGRINREMEKIKLDTRVAEMEDNLDEEIERKNAEKQATLQTEYEKLASEARKLRAMQSEDRFVYRLAGGEERSIVTGDLVAFYFPNQMGTLSKVGHFVTEIWHFLSRDPREANTEGGVFPAIFGTFVMTILMSIAVVPFGVLAAIYLREYSKQGTFVRSVRIAVNNLAGVPSIVFGVFGLGFFVYFVGGSIDSLFFPERLPTPTFGTGGVLWASLTLALMTVPVVIVSTEEALASVPRGLREASLAGGASKWQTIQRIVLPGAVPGIITGTILAMARGAGEVAPLMLVGVVKLAPTLPLDSIAPFFHLERKFMHLGFHIYDLGFQSPDSEAAKPMVFATTLLLIALVVAMNASAIIIRERLRRKYVTGAF